MERGGGRRERLRHPRNGATRVSSPGTRRESEDQCVGRDLAICVSMPTAHGREKQSIPMEEPNITRQRTNAKERLGATNQHPRQKKLILEATAIQHETKIPNLHF